MHNHILSITASESICLEKQITILNLWNPFSEHTLEEFQSTLQPVVKELDISSEATIVPAIPVSEEFQANLQI